MKFSTTLWLVVAILCSSLNAQEANERNLIALEKRYSDLNQSLVEVKSRISKLNLSWDMLQNSIQAKRSAWDALSMTLANNMNQRAIWAATPALSPEHYYYLVNCINTMDMQNAQIQFKRNQLWQERPFLIQREMDLRVFTANLHTRAAILTSNISALQIAIDELAPVVKGEQEVKALTEKTKKMQELLALSKQHEEALGVLKTQLDGTLADYSAFWDKQKADYEGSAN